MIPVTDCFRNTSLTYQTSVDSNETSLILTISNLTAAKSEFRCELDTDQNGPIHRTVKVTVFSSGRLSIRCCPFETRPLILTTIRETDTRLYKTHLNLRTIM